VLRRSLWHVTQYRSTRRRGLDAGVTPPAAERAGCADVCTWRQPHRITAAAPDATVNGLAKGKSLVMCLRREMAPAICALQYACTRCDWTCDHEIFGLGQGPERCSRRPQRRGALRRARRLEHLERHDGIVESGGVVRQNSISGWP